jgi:hypothetical protein
MSVLELCRVKRYLLMRAELFSAIIPLPVVTVYVEVVVSVDLVFE